MTFKEIIAVVGSTLAVVGVIYAGLLKTQLVIDGPIARAIAQEVAQQALAPGELERLEFQLEYKLNTLRPLQRIPKEQRSEEDQDAIDELKDSVKILKRRICTAKGGKDCGEQ